MILTVLDTLLRGYAITAATFIIVFTVVLLYISSRPNYPQPDEPDLHALYWFVGSYFLMLISFTWGFIANYVAGIPITARSWMALVALLMGAYAVGRSGYNEFRRFLSSKQEEKDD